MFNTHVVGHRGIDKLAPENTIKSFKKAIKLGVNAVECDIHCTADQELVVIHDTTADRTTNGTGNISEMQLTHILELATATGEKIPRFDQVLDTIKGKCKLICELKGTGTEIAADIVENFGLMDQVTFISSSVSRLKNVFKKFPSAQISPIFSKSSEIDLIKLKLIGAKSLDIYHKIVTQQIANKIHSAGFFLRVWTPNTVTDFERLIKIGVEAITTDRADLLLNYLNNCEIN